MYVGVNIIFFVDAIKCGLYLWFEYYNKISYIIISVITFISLGYSVLIYY